MTAALHPCLAEAMQAEHEEGLGGPSPSLLESLRAVWLTMTFIYPFQLAVFTPTLVAASILPMMFAMDYSKVSAAVHANVHGGEGHDYRSYGACTNGLLQQSIVDRLVPRWKDLECWGECSAAAACAVHCDASTTIAVVFHCQSLPGFAGLCYRLHAC
jgi:hypothetical protein